MIATAFQRITRNPVTRPLTEHLSLALMLTVTSILATGNGLLLNLLVTLGDCGGGGTSGCGV